MDDQPGLLYPYRVLDLTGERGQACGKLLADLGADVIKVEPPEGDPVRRRGPFVDDESGPDRSLRWLAWNANKRSVSLDLNDAAGRDQFLRLVRSADFVLESFAPGYLAQLRLGYDELAQVNPSLILVSISPFGQSGPYRDYKATDIVCWAMSGFMSIAGEGERPPAQISDNAQSFLNACGDAAIGALIALEQRRRTGRGQHVDVSAQEATARATFQISASWDLNRRNLARGELATPARLPGCGVAAMGTWSGSAPWVRVPVAAWPGSSAGSTRSVRGKSCARSIGTTCRSPRCPTTTGNVCEHRWPPCSSIEPSSSSTTQRSGTSSRSSRPRRRRTHSPVNNSEPGTSGATWIIPDWDAAFACPARSPEALEPSRPRLVPRPESVSTTTRSSGRFARSLPWRPAPARPRRARSRWPGSRSPTSAGSWSDR